MSAPSSSSFFSRLLAVVRSIWIWAAVVFLIVFWTPWLALVGCSTGIRCGTDGPLVSAAGRGDDEGQPGVRLHVSGERVEDPRRPYLVVSNTSRTPTFR